MKCPKCGADLAEGVLFCRECGTKIDALQKRFCRECGAALAEGAKFCTECGAKAEIPSFIPEEIASGSDIGEDSIDDISSDWEEDETIEEDIPAKMRERPRQSSKSTTKKSSSSTKNKPTHQKKKKSKVPLIIAIAAILLIVSAVSNLGKSSSSERSVSRSAESSTASEPKIAMVNVVNMAYPAALNVLQSAGFTNITSNIEPGTDESQWVVTEQSVNAGKTIKAGDKIQLTCARRCNLYIDVKSEANLMFSTYDIAINLDGIEIGTVANGKGFTYLKEVVSGEHTLVFNKSGSSSPKVTKKFLVSGDMTFSCDLAHSGSSIEIKNESRADNVGGASLEVVDVTGMVLSEAMNKLSGLGFSNVREEPYGSIWDKDNWIVVTQGLSAGSVADKNEFFQLDCISLDDYFSKTYVGKNVNEIQALANASGFSLRFESSSSNDINSKIASMSEDQKNDWTATRARQYGGADKTAVVTINNPKEVTPTPTRTPTPTSTPSPTKTPGSGSTATEKKFDVDKDLVVTQCERDWDKTTMYHVTFAEPDNSKTYSFDSIINPRAMGKNFNAIGDLPSWFYVGATVHVKANLINGHLSQSNCTVSEATGVSSGSTPAKAETPSMPVMPGTSIDTITQKVKELGLSSPFGDENWGHGTKMRTFESSSGGLSLDVCYSTSTKEILYGSITTNKLATASEQKSFITTMAPLLCPSSDKDSVSSWVSANVGASTETEINGFVYELGVGLVENPWLQAGVRSWEEWEYSFD